MTEIGLVGLGRMGVPVCANLVRAGYAVRAGDRRPEAAEQAARCGARWVPELAKLAAGADVLVTVLPGTGEVRELMLGAGGVAAAWRGALQLLVGGRAQVVAQHRELLEALARPGQLRHVGGYGAGYTVKLLVNLLWFGQAVGTAEALLLGRASGLDLGTLRDVLADSAAGSRFIDHDLPTLFAGDVMATFGLDRCCEELQIVTELARDHRLPFQASQAVADVYQRALRRYGSADGELLAVTLLEEQAGLQLRHSPVTRGRRDPDG